MINKVITKLIPIFPKSFIYLFAKKYIAGKNLEEAIKVTQEFANKGGFSTIDTLGEFVENKQQTEVEKQISFKVLDNIKKHNLPTYLSIKPTSVGLDIDFDLAYNNIQEIVDYAKEKNLFVRLDMENSPFTSKTINIYKSIRNKGYNNIGLVIQAYLKRSMEDIVRLTEYQPNVRICKGIYNESKDIAYKDKEKIRGNYIEILQYMIENDFYPAIATHDDLLLDQAESFIKSYNLDTTQYEFQMLLGVKEYKRDELLSKGHKVRLYTPYGKDWYGYSIRRLNENPQMAGHIIKSIFTLK